MCAVRLSEAKVGLRRRRCSTFCGRNTPYSETRQRWVNRLFGTTESALERVQGQESSLFEMGNSDRNLRLDDGSILGDDHAEYTLMEEE